MCMDIHVSMYECMSVLSEFVCVCVLYAQGYVCLKVFYGLGRRYLPIQCVTRKSPSSALRDGARIQRWKKEY